MSQDDLNTGISENIKLSNELRSKQLQLHWILQISKAINYNFPTEQLMGIYEFVLKEQLKIGKLALFMHDDEWVCPLHYGVDLDFTVVHVEEELSKLNEPQEIHEGRPDWLSVFDTIIPVFHKEKPLAYALIGDFKEPDQWTRKESIPFIQTISNIIVVAIENKKLAREQIKQAGVKKEMELAARMQTMLFPASLPKNDNFEITATYLPHQEVGGDYYDFIPLGDDEFIISMADVSGKGIAAALLMSNFQANLHASVKLYEDMEHMFHHLNERVYSSAKGEKFITFFLAKLDCKTGKLTYVNAGHNPPVLINNGKVELLEKGSTGLGMFEELPFVHIGEVILGPDSFVFCYTDGVVELEDSSGEHYGLDRLSDFVLKNKNIPDLEDFHRELIKELDEFRGVSAYNDDVTMLSLRTGK